MEKAIKLDGGSLEQRIKETKDFLGLKPEQSFQDLKIDDVEEVKEQKT